MKKLEVKDLLKIVPFDDDFRNEIAAEYVTYSEALKYDIQKILWDAYYEIHDQQTVVKLQQLMMEVEAGLRPLTDDMNDDAERLVEKDFEDILTGKKNELQQIDDIRAKLQSLISESKKASN